MNHSYPFYSILHKGHVAFIQIDTSLMIFLYEWIIIVNKTNTLHSNVYYSQTITIKQVVYEIEMGTLTVDYVDTFLVHYGTQFFPYCSVFPLLLPPSPALVLISEPTESTSKTADLD